MKRFTPVKGQFFSFHLAVFPIILYFSVNQTFEEICKEEQVDSSDDYTCAIIQSCTTPGRIIPHEGMNSYLCVIKGYDDSPCRRACVNHEFLHLVNFVVKKIGARLDYDNDEYTCYLLQYITESFYDNLKY